MGVKGKRRLSENDAEEESGRGKAWKKRGRKSDDKDEDEDDEYEDGMYGGKHQKRRMDVARFIDDKADVASDGEESEGSEGEQGFIEEPGADLDEENVEGQIHSSLPYRLVDDQDVDAEYLESMIAKRYGQRDDEYSDNDDEATELGQQALLPSVRDPKLWMVKCAIGREREVAVCLMQKCIERGQEIQIKSAIALDHLKNYIYIEAEKEAHVREACKGMRNIYAAKIMLVPIKEMTDVLSVKSEAVDVCRDMWVRVKTGTYKGDLAKVVDLDNVLRRVTLKLIPRVDLISLAAKMEGQEVKKNDTFIPPPRLMNSDEARELFIQVHRRFDPNTRCDFEIIGGMKFMDGFLYKDVSMKSISIHNIQPTFDEVEKFRGGNEDLASLSSLYKNKNKGHFMKGDRVVVVKGDLKNLNGTVEKVEKEIVYIKPNEIGILDTLAVAENELCKYFEPGNHVKVIAGASKGATGMVVSVEGRVVNIVSDATKELLREFADSIVKTTEITAGISSIGDYALHDLVLLHDSSFGVIVKIESEACHVFKGVPEKLEIAIVRLRDIKSKLEHKYTSKDRYGNGLSSKDMVKILEGPSRGKRGQIVHIYKETVFVHESNHVENAGFMCVKSQSCVLIGGSQVNADRKSVSFQSRYDNVRMTHVAKPSLRGARAKIKICKGHYKGCRGVVKDVRGNCLRVELEAQMKIVTVTRGEVTDDLSDSSSPSTPFRGLSRFAPGGETPIHPSQTPLRPLQTPMRDYPGTPLNHGIMRTPVHERTNSPTAAPQSPLLNTTSGSRGMLLNSAAW